MDIYALFNQALHPVDHTEWCIYALFINDKELNKKELLSKNIESNY